MGKTTQPTPPKIPAHLDRIDSIVDQEMNGVILTDQEIANHESEKLYLDKTVFENVSFHNVSLRFSELTDVKFIKCDLSNLDLSDAIIHRVEIIDSKIMGINLSGAALRNVKFFNCMANLASFSFSDLKQIRFEQCSLVQTDFYESKFLNVFYDGCNVNKANFAEVTMKKLDLSSCQFENLTVSMEKLEGCIVSPEQALGFAKAIGLVIKEQ
ncbi:pentapeptide repeat-containing protein [Bacillus carboniphilus]|uniref:Pentapeptide repeat-containing protein n=1 Tax=Bacillus carboniphilus TaxID=86663 RepID=A0ABY9JR68_9BACI|nr:pentapeptide repeat-containing protein [Bacillus carboniphilus]WLR41213.1 pentapeptide repeat-containing protein [Bacillus carboniphilus]